MNRDWGERAGHGPGPAPTYDGTHGHRLTDILHVNTWLAIWHFWTLRSSL